jgi:hypothetical protein
MALPQNPLSDRQLFDTLKTQNESLSAQTKVLHKLSDTITDQRKDFAALRKDIQEAQKELLRGNNKGMSEIQKYFAKYKTDNTSGKIREKDQSTGFFKGIFNKLFGPSKYQQKMLDEITRTRELTESTALDINFIRKQNEDGPRARERELLAQLIADKINSNNSNTTSDDSSSLLGTLGKFGAVLISGVGALLAGLGATIVSGLSFGWRILSTIGSLLEAYFASKVIGKVAGGGGAGIPPASGAPGPTADPNQKRIPGKETPQIEGPSKPKDMGTLKQGRGGVYVPEGAAGQGIKFGILQALKKFGPYGLAAGTVLGELLGEKSAPPPEQNDPENPMQKLDKMLEDTWLGKAWNSTKNKAAELSFSATEGDANRSRRDFAENDPRRLDKKIDDVEANTDMFNDAIKQVVNGLVGMGDALDDVANQVIIDSRKMLADPLNKLGEIELAGGQKINLMPNLGDAAFDVLKESYDDSKAMTKALAEGAGTVINNVYNNMQEGGKGATLVPLSASSIATTTSMSAYLRMRGFR